MDRVVPILMVAMAVLGIVAVIIYTRKEKERRERLQTLAGRLGFAFTPSLLSSPDAVNVRVPPPGA